MLAKIFVTAGLILTGSGFLLLQTSRSSGDSLGISLALMGAGVLLMMMPSYSFASADLHLLRGGPEDKKLSNELKLIRLRFLCITAGVAGFICFQFAPNGINGWTLGFLGLILASGLVYAAGHARLGGSGAASNVFRLIIGGAAFAGFIVSVVTLITHLSGASDMPTRWNVYSYLGAAGLTASIYAFYYSLMYQTNTDLLDLLEPLGFTLADSGPLGRDGKYDARGTWMGVETLVNVNQTERHKNSPASFYLEVSCAVANWSGRRLLVHPGGFLNRPLGMPLALPKAPTLPGWERHGIYCEPPEAAQPLLTALGGQDGPVQAAGSQFSYLLLDAGRLALGVSMEGHPKREYIKRVMTLTALAAKRVS